MVKIKEIIDNYREGGPLEVWYSPTRHHRPASNILVWDNASCSPGFEFVRDVNIEDLWADSVELFKSEPDYVNAVQEISMFTWEEYSGVTGCVLVIWLSSLSHRILTDPSINRVYDIRLDRIGQYSELIAVRIPKQKKAFIDDEDEYGVYAPESDDFGDSDSNYTEIRPSAKIVSLPRDLLDKKWAQDYYLVGENDMDTLPFTINDLSWTKEESFEEHYGRPDASILIVVLA